MSRFTTSAGLVLVAGSLLAGCGGGPQGYSPPAPSTAAPVTSAPVTGAPVTSAPVTTAPTTAPSGTVTVAPSTAPTGTVTVAPSTAPTGTVTPSTAPTLAAPTATPIPTPPPGTADYHPDASGSTYTFTGSSLTTYTRPNQYPSPEPTQTTTVSITQNVTVSNPATFDGNSSAYDFHTIESDQQTAPAPQGYSMTFDNYYAYTNTLYTGDFQFLGFTSSDNNGDTVMETLGANGDIADILPEAAGASWTNPPTATISTTFPSNQSSTETIAADGTYQTTITYQNVNAMGPTTTAVVQSKLDQSGSYTTPRLGTDRSANYSYTVMAPTGGNITETTIIPPAAGSTSTPEPVSTTIPSWIPTGFTTALANETDNDMGMTTIPKTCAVPASLGTMANVVVQKKNRIDPMLGQTEVTTTTNYVIPNVGPACVAVDDVLSYYYDFTGQNGVGYFSGVVQQVSELQETLSLTNETIASTLRTAGQRFAYSHSVNPRIELALAHITSARAVERGLFLSSIANHRHFDASSASHRGLL